MRPLGCIPLNIRFFVFFTISDLHEPPLRKNRYYMPRMSLIMLSISGEMIPDQNPSGSKKTSAMMIKNPNGSMLAQASD
jgi:hypothetical protein